MSISVAIADDHLMVIKGIQVMLNGIADIDVSDIYVDGNDLLRGLKMRQPDVLLLDIQMPGMTGVEVAPIIKEQYPDIKILILTNQDQTYHVQNMINNGVMGYLLKSTSQDVLVEAIHAVFAGNQFIDPALRKQLVEDMLIARKKEAATPALTEREHEVLQLIAENFTSQEIAEKLFLSKRTIDHHRMSLLFKLGAKNSSSLTKKAIDLGLIK